MPNVGKANATSHFNVITQNKQEIKSNQMKSNTTRCGLTLYCKIKFPELDINLEWPIPVVDLEIKNTLQYGKLM